MSARLDDLLSRLEDVSAEAVRLTDPALNDVADSAAAFEKVNERGGLVQQLNAELAAAHPLSYTDFNRLVVIHYQGSRVQENLRLTRNQIAGQLSANNRERAYFDCVTGGLDLPRTPHLASSV